MRKALCAPKHRSREARIILVGQKGAVRIVTFLSSRRSPGPEGSTHPRPPGARSVPGLLFVLISGALFLSIGVGPGPAAASPGEQARTDREHGVLPAMALQEPGVVSEQDLLVREIEALEDSLDLALRSLESGRARMARIREEVRRLKTDIENLEDEPGYYMLRDRLLKLQSTLLASSLRIRPEIPFPEDPNAPEAESWRRLFPEMEEFVETRTRKEIFMIGRDVEIGVFEKVRGDVVVIGGSVTVQGAVGGNVVSVGNNIRVTSTGRIEGDAVTIGGRITQEPGGTIKGDWIDTSTFWPSRLFAFRYNPLAWFAALLTGLVFVLVATLITGLIAPSNVARIERQVRLHFGTSFLVGLVTEVLLPVLIILLLITIIGIPVAIILVPIALLGLLLLGFTGVAMAVGRGAERRGLRVGDSTLGLITVGVLIIEAIYLLGKAFGFAQGLLSPLAFFTGLLGGLILYVAWTTGLGAALMTRFGTRVPGEMPEPGPPKPAPSPVGAESET